VSFCRWKESTLTLPYESSKTAWPVSQTESFFLPEFPLLTGDKEKKYKNLGEINKGAFGKVYRVEEEGRVYALKVLSKSKVSVFFFLRVDETDYRRSESLTQT
jgi:serine/threonine protein kinase